MTTKISSPRSQNAEDAQLEAAIRRHEERVQRDPGSLAFAQLADLYRKAGRTTDAITVCRQGLAKFPQYMTARLILAKACVAEGLLEDAAAETQAMLTTNPRDPQARRLAADIARQRGLVDEAATHLEALLTVDPTDREARALLPLLRADPAASDATALLRVPRDDVFITETFGTACLEQGCAEEAALVFTRLLRNDPSPVTAREGLEQALRLRLRRKG
jgi:tetratricopeptide (TPR) repeat protein